MTITQNKIYMTRGDTAVFAVSLDGRMLIDGDVVEMTVRKRPEHPQRAIYKKVTEFREGKAIITLNPEDTQHLPFGEYSYDVQVTFEGGRVATIVKPTPFVIGQEDTYG